LLSFLFWLLYSGADPGFQVRGGALKKIAPSGGRRKFCWGISCEKSRFYAKKIIFFPILGGGGGAGGAPHPWIRPWYYLFFIDIRLLIAPLTREVFKDFEPFILPAYNNIGYIKGNVAVCKHLLIMSAL
jgi:hypothetical protein